MTNLGEKTSKIIRRNWKTGPHTPGHKTCIVYASAIETRRGVSSAGLDAGFIKINMKIL
ncbi:hypothetical protein [Acidaminococcus massiliensis]|jgi:hypothetical protein|uniref:hypothetical protein n=1 Tax=Acidaminococcus massiliensis TaxID=1852375 RepID=UPI00266CB12D|nr:hypothetical protein [Acidaminococcus massiliensis]